MKSRCCIPYKVDSRATCASVNRLAHISFFFIKFLLRMTAAISSIEKKYSQFLFRSPMSPLTPNNGTNNMIIIIDKIQMCDDWFDVVVVSSNDDCNPGPHDVGTIARTRPPLSFFISIFGCYCSETFRNKFLRFPCIDILVRTQISIWKRQKKRT